MYTTNISKTMNNVIMINMLYWHYTPIPWIWACMEYTYMNAHHATYFTWRFGYLLCIYITIHQKWKKLGMRWSCSVWIYWNQFCAYHLLGNVHLTSYIHNDTHTIAVRYFPELSYLLQCVIKCLVYGALALHAHDNTHTRVSGGGVRACVCNMGGCYRYH